MFFLFINIFALIGHFSKGYKNYILTSQEIKLIDSMERSMEDRCKLSIPKCIKKAINNNSKAILLLGDSNAYHFSKGLNEIALNNNYKYV